MSRLIRVIPERTVDAWLAAAIIARFPQARVWAPTPPSQAASQPWDYKVGTLDARKKLFILESKALIGYVKQDHRCRVKIDLRQLAVLWALSLGNDVPIFYALPSLTDDDLPVNLDALDPFELSSLRLSPAFGKWLRIVPVTQLVNHSSVQSAATQQEVSIQVQDLPTGYSLDTFLKGLRDCKFGRIFDVDTGGHVFTKLPIEDRALALLGQIEGNRSVQGDLSALIAETMTAEPDSVGGWTRKHLHRTQWWWLGSPDIPL